MRRNVSTAATPAIFLGPNDRFGRSSRSWSSDFDEESLEETLRKAQEMLGTDVDVRRRAVYGRQRGCEGRRAACVCALCVRIRGRSGGGRRREKAYNRNLACLHLLHLPPAPLPSVFPFPSSHAPPSPLPSSSRIGDQGGAAPRGGARWRGLRPERLRRRRRPARDVHSDTSCA